MFEILTEREINVEEKFELTVCTPQTMFEDNRVRKKVVTIASKEIFFQKEECKLIRIRDVTLESQNEKLTKKVLKLKEKQL